MMQDDIKFAAEVADARLILRWAGQVLTRNERACITAWLADESGEVTARKCGITRGGVWMLRQSALQKLRRKLRSVGITSTQQLLSEQPTREEPTPVEVAA